ncbi:4Fe-4S dicluster domain-containing protein [Parabacteroides sp. Marseille-P3160]|uniref:ATP-binding protein n=1 Tax=Parabacteroides sp. Marseille-P3160 TaxID=1917887 RepID=UPI0009B94AF5
MIAVYVSASVLLILFLEQYYYRRAHRENKIIHIKNENCVRCRSCVSKCRRHVLEIANESNGNRLIIKNPDLCTGCGQCINVCNFKALELKERIKNAVV